ncbi:hypothetical protein [Bradyrhizobium sp. ORS 111]|uniref:hypothetical protein n=1 Tax=Bradyrhizobium sp. ORS 111 TaxID=1685958 RepID=UPI00388E9D3B
MQRIWHGEDLRCKRVLVRCYHGLGDTIQFVRFIPALRSLARGVTVWCQPELLEIVERIEGVDRAIALHEGAPATEFDVDIEIMEIPHAIRAGRDLISTQVPYLSLPSERGNPIAKSDQKLAIGLVWEVGDWDKRRSIPAGLLRRLAVENVTLYSLQRGVDASMAAGIGARDISAQDIVVLGHTIAQMDIVVCVDSMVAHLAGALGFETWVLLHADCDWRWPLTGERSIWYPTLRLFHQLRPGDWATVVEEVRSALLGRIALRDICGKDGSSA